MEKLIIIRGPSGAGKSSIARVLTERSDRPTLLIEQDQIRQKFNDQGPKANVPVWEMVEADTTIGLNNGFDVILEGILNIQKDGQRKTLERILKAHPDENYIFYMDVQFDETLRRHATRNKNVEFGENEMKEWWDLSTPMDHLREVVISQPSSLEETVRTIGKIAGLNLKTGVK
jgi:predicted kinase